MSMYVKAVDWEGPVEKQVGSFKVDGVVCQEQKGNDRPLLFSLAVRKLNCSSLYWKKEKGVFPFTLHIKVISLKVYWTIRY